LGEIKWVPELSFTVYIWTNSDQPRAKRSLLVWWFDEKNVLFGEAAIEVAGIGEHWKRIVARVVRD
jgi:hypothetical protein